MSQRLSQVNCLMYHDGRCGHPSARGFFDGRSCVLQAGDPRVTQCAVMVERERPPPSKPGVPENETFTLGGGISPSWFPNLECLKPKPPGDE